MNLRCPECGSDKINQYRMPFGAMWCRGCNYRIEDKNAQPNPFVEAYKRLPEGERNPKKPDPADDREG